MKNRFHLDNQEKNMNYNELITEIKNAYKIYLYPSSHSFSDGMIYASYVTGKINAEEMAKLKAFNQECFDRSENNLPIY
jgi:hypothetical protein